MHRKSPARGFGIRATSPALLADALTMAGCAPTAANTGAANTGAKPVCNGTSRFLSQVILMTGSGFVAF
jgi:hypothetical protein